MNRDLILCGYRYNSSCNIIYYESESRDIICADPKLIFRAFTDGSEHISLDTEHFDQNIFQVYQDLYDAKPEGVVKRQSNDVFDFTCKVLNFRPLLLKLCKHVFENQNLLNKQSEEQNNDLEVSFNLGNELEWANMGRSWSSDATNFDGQGAKGAKSTNKQSAKIFSFDTEEFEFSEKRKKKFSEDILEELNVMAQTPLAQTSAFEPARPEPPKIERLPDEDLRDLNLLKDRRLQNRPELRYFIYLLAYIAELLLVLHSFLYKLMRLVVSFDLIFNTTASQIVFRIKSTQKMYKKIKTLNVKQPVKVSLLSKEITFISNCLLFTLFDLCLGFALLLLTLRYQDSITSFLHGLHKLIHPDVFKKQLLQIGENPAGIKLDETYCGIISKLTQIIFIVQDLWLTLIMRNLFILLKVVSFFSLFGLSFALSFITDVSNLVFFQIKVTFIFINLIFTEHTHWFRVFFRVFQSQRFNSQENVAPAHPAHAGAVLLADHALHRPDAHAGALHPLPHDQLLLGLELSAVRVHPHRGGRPCSADLDGRPAHLRQLLRAHGLHRLQPHGRHLHEDDPDQAHLQGQRVQAHPQKRLPLHLHQEALRSGRADEESPQPRCALQDQEPLRTLVSRSSQKSSSPGESAKRGCHLSASAKLNSPN